MPKNDSAIVARVQAGNLNAFGILYDRYINKIYDFVYFKTHHKETAEDLTSFVFFKALEKINSFKQADSGNFSAWLYRIARNIVIDHCRTLKNNANIEDIWDLSDSFDIQKDLDMKNKLKEVQKYLQTLSSEQRDIIIMRLWQDMSYSEIAAVLGKSEAGCKMAFSRVMQKLRSDIILVFLFLLFRQ